MVGIVHGGAVFNGVVVGPQCLVVRGQAGELQAGVAVVVEVHLPSTPPDMSLSVRARTMLYSS